MTKWIMLVLVLALSQLQYKLWVGSKGAVKEVFRLKAAIVAEREEIEKQLRRNRALSLEVLALKGKPLAFEERARAELGMIRANETFCIILEK